MSASELTSHPLTLKCFGHKQFHGIHQYLYRKSMGKVFCVHCFTLTLKYRLYHYVGSEVKKKLTGSLPIFQFYDTSTALN